MRRLTALLATVLVAAGMVVVVADVDAEPRPDQCYDLFELHAGKGVPQRQEWFNYLDAQGYARYWIACTKNWGTEQWDCLHLLWDEESGWYHLADGPNGPAGNTWGIPQAYPESKLLDPNQGGGPDGKTNPRTQVRWGVDYIDARYGVPTNTPRRCHAGY